MKKHDDDSLTNLDRIRDIILGADFNEFADKIKKQEQAFEQAQITFNNKFESIQKDLQKREKDFIKKSDELEQTVFEKLEQFESKSAQLEEDLMDTTKIIKKEFVKTADKFKSQLNSNIKDFKTEQREAMASLKKERSLLEKKITDKLYEVISNESETIHAKVNEFSQQLTSQLNSFQTYFQLAVNKLEDNKISPHELGKILALFATRLMEKSEQESGETPEKKRSTTKTESQRVKRKSVSSKIKRLRAKRRNAKNREDRKEEYFKNTL